MPLNLGFPEKDYPRMCAMCGWMADPGYPWEENLNPPTHCPRDGMPLERLSCQACGAPVMVQTGYNSFFGRSMSLGSMCVHCGERVTRSEQKLREKPPEQKKKEAQSALATSPLISIPQSLSLVFDDYFKRPKIEYVVAKPPEWMKRACARGKAAVGCTCAGCKAVRRLYRRRSRARAR